MSVEDPELDGAEERARLARAQLIETMGDLQARLTPRALIGDAMHEVREAADTVIDGAIDYAQRKPMQVAAVGALVALAALPRPTLSLLSRIFRRKDETDAPADQLNIRNDARADRALTDEESGS